MTMALILNLTAMTAVIILLTATMRLPYRLPDASGERRRRANRVTEPSTTLTATLRGAHPEPEMT